MIIHLLIDAIGLTIAVLLITGLRQQLQYYRETAASHRQEAWDKGYAAGRERDNRPASEQERYAYELGVRQANEAWSLQWEELLRAMKAKRTDGAPEKGDIYSYIHVTIVAGASPQLSERDVTVLSGPHLLVQLPDGSQRMMEAGTLRRRHRASRSDAAVTTQKKRVTIQAAA